MNRPYAIAVKSAPATPLLVLGTGLPQKVRDKTCHYIQREMAYAKRFHHRGTGEVIDLPNERLAKLAATIQRRAAKGIFPPLTPYHVEPAHEFNANDTLGYVIGAEHKDGKLFANLQVIGDDALDTVDKNGLSIATFMQDVIDADGEPDEETLHHLAATPDGALPHLCPTLKIAASAGGGPAREVRIFTLSAVAERSTVMKPETIAKLRAKLNLAADVKDEDVAERAAALALADPPAPAAPTEEAVKLSATYKAVATELDTLKREAETLRLSAASAPRQPDELTLAMYGENIAAKREAAVASGAVSEAEAKVFDALIADVNGRPTPLALSACGPAKRPLGFQLWDAVAKLAEGEGGKVRTGQKVNRAVGVAPGPNHQSLALSGAGSQSDDDAAKAGKEQGEAYKNRQLEARALAKAGT